MSLSWIYFVSFVVLAIAFGLLGWLIYQTNREKDEPENQPLALNYLSDYTNGHGWVRVDKRKDAGEVEDLEVFPFDINPNSVKNKHTVIKKYPLFPSKCHIIDLGCSTHKQSLMILPEKPEDLPEIVKGTEWGEFLMQWIERKSTSKKIIDIHREAIDSLDSVNIDANKTRDQMIADLREQKEYEKKLNQPERREEIKKP